MKPYDFKARRSTVFFLWGTGSVALSAVKPGWFSYVCFVFEIWALPGLARRSGRSEPPARAPFFPIWLPGRLSDRRSPVVPWKMDHWRLLQDEEWPQAICVWQPGAVQPTRDKQYQYWDCAIHLPSS